MFKWSCLGVAVVVLGVFGWMINDLRQEIKQAATTANQNLPQILEKSQVTADSLKKNLPEILEKSRATATTLAEVSDDIKQLRDLAGIAGKAPGEKLAKYADSVLDLIESSGGTIGLKKKLLGEGLKDTLPAKEWVVAARKEALYLTFAANSRKELLERLAKNKFGSAWHIQFGGKEPVTLLDWIKANHPESKATE